MVTKIIWTERASRDLAAIITYISHDSPANAEQFAMRLIENTDLLEVVPERGEVVAELGDPTIRQIVFGNYRIIHQHRRNEVSILRIIHSARDFYTAWTRG